MFYLLVFDVLLLQPEHTQVTDWDPFTPLNRDFYFPQYSLNDHLQGLSQRNWLVVQEVKVQLMAEERRGLQQSVEFLFNHLIFFFWHLETHKIGTFDTLM